MKGKRRLHRRMRFIGHFERLILRVESLHIGSASNENTPYVLWAVSVGISLNNNGNRFGSKICLRRNRAAVDTGGVKPGVNRIAASCHLIA